MNVKSSCFITVFLLEVFCGFLFAQGPQLDYFYDSATELPWAFCRLYFENGSTHKLPFMPVIDRSFRGPCGSCAYSRDINIDGRIVYVGNGIVKPGVFDCYQGTDVSGRVVMFCFDLSDSLSAEYSAEITVEDRINEAASHGAAAVVLFSHSDKLPLLGCKFSEKDGSAPIPAITLSHRDARTVLESTLSCRALEENRIKTQNLVAKIAIHIASGFKNIDTEYFTLRYSDGSIPDEKMRELAEVNNRSISFILSYFRDNGENEAAWSKSSITYFSNYDSKVFFTAHWGSGFSSREARGVFSVYDGSAADYRLSVHENTHSLTYDLWDHSGSCSFIEEGIAKLLEDEATDKDKNNLATYGFLAKKELSPLRELVKMNIGSSELTYIGYPAAGSFAGFVVERYSLSTYGKAFRSPPEAWCNVFGKSMDELEKEWLGWLVDKFVGEK